MSVNAEKPVPIYLKRFPNKKKVVRIPMVGERPSDRDMLEIPLPKSELRAHLSSTREKLSNGNNLVDCTPMELGCLALLLNLTTSTDGYLTLCDSFDLYENKSGRAKQYHLKGGAFISMVLLFGKFPITQLTSAQLCSLLGFKTSEGEDVQSHVYRMKKEFMEYALYKEGTAFQLKQQKLNTALFESIQFFLALKPSITDNETKLLYNKITSKFNEIGFKELNTISARILNDQNTLDILVVK
ncbi:hypothetical protein FC650_20040 [Vibrio natriegens]|uniref:hypothetical protein n=1 Tax=Vibrio natriegens TaxID=691 RepID=UPI00159309A3|nr:hypothetical protein [Vibrio natriegens]NVC95861.1 hypothetical protein [Vibrio natriegens]